MSDLVELSQWRATSLWTARQLRSLEEQLHQLQSAAALEAAAEQAEKEASYLRPLHLSTHYPQHPTPPTPRVTLRNEANADEESRWHRPHWDTARAGFTAAELRIALDASLLPSATATAQQVGYSSPLSSPVAASPLSSPAKRHRKEDEARLSFILGDDLPPQQHAEKRQRGEQQQQTTTTLRRISTQSPPPMPSYAADLSSSLSPSPPRAATTPRYATSHFTISMSPSPRKMDGGNAYSPNEPPHNPPAPAYSRLNFAGGGGRSSSPPSVPNATPLPASPSSRKFLPSDVTALLRRWYYAHIERPYPTPQEKQAIRRATGLTLTQLNNWLSNARRRLDPAADVERK